MKFRAWDKELNEMLYPDDTDKILFEINEYGITTYDVRYLDEYGSFAAELDSVVMQSTGLKDKNGKEIFEGDILKVFFLRDMGAIAKVIFKNGMFGIEDDMHGYGYDKGLYSLDQILSLRDAEIIGNIYQDKHLLEEE